MSKNRLTNERLITDFSNLAKQKWEIVNDGVMGGLSQSGFQINEEGNAVFIGQISLENNGGFASVRNRETINLEGFENVRLRIKGDGKRYSFRLRTGENDKPYRFSYDVRFDTKADQWMVVTLPFSDFQTYFRGMPVMDVPPLDLSAVKQYGFLISDKQEGKFRLEISAIWAVANDE